MKKDRLNFLSSVQPSTTLSGVKPGKLILRPVQVLEVILSDPNPDYIGAIRYRPLGQKNELLKTCNAPIAFPLRSHIKQIPLVDEVVLLVGAPGKNLRDSVNSSTVYYTDIVNIWNHPQHGSCPLSNSPSTAEEDFAERPDLNPLTPFTGDVILEGRLGQSIRMSQSIPGKTPWKGALGDPIIVFSNGQVETSNGYVHILEDINKDFSSLYLTSKHIIDLKPKNILTSTLNNYEGAQAILTGDRLILNAKQDNIYITTPGLLETTSESTKIQAKNTINLQANRINLGAEASQRAILGDSMLAELSAVLTQVSRLATAISPLGSTFPAITEASAQTIVAITNFQTKIDTLKSNTTFIK